MACQCSEWNVCSECMVIYHEQQVASYTEAADREVVRAEAEYRAECKDCVRCAGPAFRGICDRLDCQVRGIASGELSPEESKAVKCSLCKAMIEDMHAATLADWVPGYWDGDRWCDPACDVCFDREIEFDEECGEYVRVKRKNPNDNSIPPFALRYLSFPCLQSENC